MLTQMVPPDFTRIVPIGWKLLETLQMAVAGCFLGLILALPFAILATDRLSPHPLVRHAARGLIALFRTVPDLVWAIIFIIVVGLGPAARSHGDHGRQDRLCRPLLRRGMEGTDPRPPGRPARHRGQPPGADRVRRDPRLSALLHRHLAFRAGKVPCAGPPPWALSARVASGVDLKVAFDLFNYDEALAIILMMLALVIAVEQGSGWIRRKLI